MSNTTPACLLCARPLSPTRIAAGATDCCCGCGELVRSDSLMRDAYAAKGGTFAAVPQGKRTWWRHGTATGYRRHGCQCEPCLTAGRAGNRRDNAVAHRGLTPPQYS